LEKQSTNLTTYSNDATQQGFNNMSATANTTTSPDGTQNADTITPSAGTSDHYLITNGSTVSSGVIHTISVFVKKKDSDYLYFGTGGSAAWGQVSYRFSTNTFFNISGPSGYSATDMGNGWIRLTNTGTTGGTDLRILLTPSDSSGGRTFNANGTDGLYIWGLQIEQSSYVTSAIETTSASATRVADACSKTGISSLIGQTEGTIFFDGVINGVGNTSTNIINSEKNTTCSFYVQRVTSSSQINAGFIFSGSTTAVVNGGTIAVGQRIKIGWAYKSGSNALYINGTLIDSNSTTFTPPSTFDDLFLNDDTTYFGYQEAVQFNQVAVFPTRLTNAELASLTTL
jgi:hypothetical protein